jgi:predicted PurR-regulated permease PerM
MALLTVIAALKLSEDLLAPLLFALFVAIALAPPVRWLSAIMPRRLAAAIVVVGLVGAAVLAGYSLSDDVTAFSKRLPSLVREVKSSLESASPRQGPIRQLQQALSELQRAAAPPDAPGTTPVTIVESVDVQKEMMAGATSTAAFAGQAILLCFFVYFLLAAGDQFKAKLVTISGPKLSAQKVTVQMIDEMTTKIGRFVFYQVWSGAVVGIVTWLAFLALGMRYAALWGLAAGVVNCVPYFGPTVVMAASGFAALLQFHSIPVALGVAAVSVVITSVEGMVLAPVMLGQASEANAVAVFLALMFWGWLWGPIGLVIAVPVLMVVKTVADHVESLSPLGLLLSE